MLLKRELPEDTKIFIRHSIFNFVVFIYLFKILAVSAKNCLLLTYGMTLGLPTIAIPALYHTSASNSSSIRQDELLQLNKEQTSWFS